MKISFKTPELIKKLHKEEAPKSISKELPVVKQQPTQDTVEFKGKK
ncbi:MAG: hypothetical protein ACD_20C00435G0003 [uncultured bacterium]|nr:MAG: hypothetical protein ACD_20C00435G0003 [uncultured bacterium]